MEHTETSIVANGRLESITEFNLYPVRYMHVSWLKELQYAQIIEALGTSEESHFYLSVYILNSFDVTNSSTYEFDTLDKKIALSSSEDLAKLVLYIGIVLNESVIRGVIQRDEREKLERCLGEEAYFFAVKKAQFLAKKGNELPPDVLIDWQQVDHFKSYLIVCGLKVLATVYSGLSREFKQRLSFKFPKSWSKHLDSPSESLSSKQQGERLLIKSYKEVNKQWQHQLS